MTSTQIKEWRKAHGYSQKQLADALSIPKRTVEEWEAARGKGKPPAYLELALAELARKPKKKRA